jgi:hypothetical protein
MSLVRSSSKISFPRHFEIYLEVVKWPFVPFKFSSSLQISFRHFDISSLAYSYIDAFSDLYLPVSVTIIKLINK